MVRKIANSAGTSLAVPPGRQRRSKPATVETVLEGFEVPPELSAEADPEPAAGSTGFAAAVLAEQLPSGTMTPLELRTRMSRAWQPPASDLRLTNRRI